VGAELILYLKFSFTLVIDMLEDLVIDVPRSPSYLAKFIAYGILDGYLNLIFLESSLKPLVNSKVMSPSDLVAEVFSFIIESRVSICNSLLYFSDLTSSFSV
jgi:hypothetical protein